MKAADMILKGSNVRQAINAEVSDRMKPISEAAGKYERVVFLDGSKSKAVILRIQNESDTFLSGIEVNKIGDEVVPKGHTERLRVIDKQVIVKRTPMKMNLRYGELEQEEAKVEKIEIEVSGTDDKSEKSSEPTLGDKPEDKECVKKKRNRFTIL